MYQRELGDRAHISDIELGLALPSLAMIERIGERLNVPVGALLGANDHFTCTIARFVPHLTTSQKKTVLEVLKELSNEAK